LDVSLLDQSLDVAGSNNIEAWDGYYAEVVKDTGADKILTLDDDFDDVDGVDFEVVLNQNEFEKLSDFIDQLNQIRVYDDLK